MSVALLDLAKFFSGITAPKTALPSLIHSTKGTNIYDIVGEGKLNVKPCSLFKGDNLLYFFVGRPAYKTSNLPISDFWLTPIAFVFRNPLPITPKRIFPFDSGAFVERRLGEEFADFELCRFELGGDYNNIRKIIKVFFGSVGKYMRAQAKQREKNCKGVQNRTKRIQHPRTFELVVESCLHRAR